MKTIHKLPPDLIAKIAAGEVIERPAYAIKELLDNSIDAGADVISIQIENSGFKKIVITDNGEGMSEEDLLECFNLHTTSKIKPTDSLIGIKTHGFRGEALSSIASVAKVTIKSKTAQAKSGMVIEINNNQLISQSPIGMPDGTTVEITNIFQSVPARKQFLKSPQTEYRLILEIIYGFLISFPNIRFRLKHNQKMVFDYPKSTLKDRISSVLGQTIDQNSLPIKIEDSYFCLNGILVKPQLATTSLSKQYLFINNRKVTDRIISQTIKDAYQTLIPKTHYPIFVLFLTIPHELVDTNIHPRKEMVGLLNSQYIYDVVFKAASKTLTDHNLTFSSLHWFGEKGSATKNLLGSTLRDSVNAWKVMDEVSEIDLKTIQLLHNLYISVQTKDGLFLIDQHAAHERILFEQYKDEFLIQKKNAILNLKTPVELKINQLSLEALFEQKDELKKIGFEIERNQKNNLVIKTIPQLFKDRDFSSFFEELAEQIIETGSIKNIDFQSEIILKYLACKTAIKAGDRISIIEAKRLIEKLLKTPNNTTCPHGRPTRILVSLDQLNASFKR